MRNRHFESSVRTSALIVGLGQLPVWVDASPELCDCDGVIP
jgi:hypothetical protein